MVSHHSGLKTQVSLYIHCVPFWLYHILLYYGMSCTSGVRGSSACIYAGGGVIHTRTKIQTQLYKTALIMCRHTRLLGCIECNIFSCGLPLCQTTFTANQNSRYISQYIHAHHSSIQNNIYFVNFKHITNNFRV